MSSNRPRKRLTSLADQAENELPADFFERSLHLSEHNPLFGPNTEIKNRVAAYEDLLRMATLFSIPTIVAMVREHGFTRGVTEERVEDRIQEGIELVAEKYGVRIKHVRREFERVKEANLEEGVEEGVLDGEDEDHGDVAGDDGLSSGDARAAGTISGPGEDAEVLKAAAALMKLRAEADDIMDESWVLV